MGVTFEKKRKIFHLFTKNFSYYIHVNKYNYLIHLYSGKYLNDISKERVSERYMEPVFCVLYQKSSVLEFIIQ